MASGFPNDRLQPSLFDRLSDDLAASLVQFSHDRQALDLLLTDVQRQALTEYLADDRLERRLAAAEAPSPFDTLSEAARLLFDRVISVEIARRQQMRRSVMMNREQLRTALLRDLQNLLNTTAPEADLELDDRSLDAVPAVQVSVLNYGIPALSGRIRTTEDVLELAREIERAIECYEPRIRHVHVSVADVGTFTSPLHLVIEGELWGYPVAERMRLQTVLDLDAGHAEIAGAERAA